MNFLRLLCHLEKISFTEIFWNKNFSTMTLRNINVLEETTPRVTQRSGCHIMISKRTYMHSVIVNISLAPFH